MTYSLTWLPDILRREGLKVAELPGWTTRGHGDMGRVRGVILHHTAGSATGNMPSLSVLEKGRPGLAGPLANLGLGRDGTVYVIAAGRASHAGTGSWRAVTTGNSSFIGIEAENTGEPSDPWPDVQMDACRRAAAAMLRHVGEDALMCCGHREFALPRGRKVDPTFNIDTFRDEVRRIIMGRGVARPQIPASDVATGKLTLRRGDRGRDVELVQDVAGFKVDGRFGPATEAAIRRFQREHNLVPDGIVGPRTWAAILLVPASAPAAE